MTNLGLANETVTETSEIKKKVTLPQWLLDELPEHGEVATICFNEETNSFSIDKLDQKFETVRDAYDFLKKETEYQISLDDSLDGRGGILMGPSFFDGSGGILFGVTSYTKLRILESSYRFWIEDVAPFYEENSQDWVFCYNWLSVHPMSWTKNSSDKSFSWKTQEGADIYSIVGRDQNGNPEINTECGPHSPESNYTVHSHDVDLNMCAPTFEQIYIDLAAKVNELYNIDGTPKENI